MDTIMTRNRAFSFSVLCSLLLSALERAAFSHALVPCELKRSQFAVHVSSLSPLLMAGSDAFGDFDDDDDDFNKWRTQSVEKIESDQKKHLAIGDKEPRALKPSHFFSQKSLLDPAFQLSQELFNNLCRGAGISRPSKIQNLAWPMVLQGKNVVIAEQTGSGKTLAYLVPLLQRALASSDKAPHGAPRILVLAPTAELADQIHAVCLKLASHASLKTMVVTSSGNYATNIRDQIRMLERQSIDILVSTPGRIATILRTRNAELDLSYLQALVLDEVDVLMMDETFAPQLRTVGAAVPVERAQFVFCTATLPDTVQTRLEQEFPVGLETIKGPGLHKVAPSVKEHLVDVSVPAQHNRDAQFCFDVKTKHLLTALRTTKCRRTLIFCNTVESCRKVENLLQRRDRRSQVYDVRTYHNALAPKIRLENLKAFSKSPTDAILVCTDRAARGVDFDAQAVDHVLLFDFPRDPAEYVRRVGRTARAGREGTCTVFVYGWQLPVASAVMNQANKRGTIGNIEAFMDQGDNEDSEFRGGVQGRKGKRKSKEELIKGNIEGGKMWKEQSDPVNRVP